MTSRERLLTALQGGQADRVPMVLRMPKFMRKYYGDASDGSAPATDAELEFGTSLAEIPDGLVLPFRAQEEFGTDLWHHVTGPKLPCFRPEATHWRDDVEVEIAHEIRDGRQYWERTIHTPEGDLHDVKQALIVAAGSGDGPEIIEPLIKDVARDLPLMPYMMMDPAKIDVGAAVATDEAIGDRGLGVAGMYGAIDSRDAMKQTDFLMLYYDDREALREIVRIGADAMMAETKRVLDGGLKVIFTWWFYTSPSGGWSPRIYEEMFLPHVVRHVELVHSYGGIYIYYDDGKMGRFLDMYVDAGIDCLMTCTPPPMGDADPAMMKARYGDRICLMGGIDVVNEVHLSDPDSIRGMVEERLAIYKPGGGYIMDGSNSLVYETPSENVRALAAAGREFCGY